jgi:hypothetical protein
VVDGIAQTTRSLAVTGHSTDHAIEAALNRGCVLIIRIVQDVRQGHSIQVSRCWKLDELERDIG